MKAYLERIRFVNQQGRDRRGPLGHPPRDAGGAADAARARGDAQGRSPGSRCWSRHDRRRRAPTTAGSLALEDVTPSADAALVARLKAAGAIILGKVNVTELNGMVSTGQPAGYGALHGQVLNPYDMRSTVNGSSAGAVAAAASGLRPRPSASRPTRAPTARPTRRTATRSARSSPPSTPAWWRCARRSGSSRAPACCRSPAARRRPRPSAARSATWPRCSPASWPRPADSTAAPDAPDYTRRSRSRRSRKRIAYRAGQRQRRPAFTDAVAEITAPAPPP